jgi:YegS/Rv2252/BmrU family lipid kinase
MQSLAIIVNATSGTGCPQGWAAEVESKFAAQGVRATVVAIQSGSEITAAAQRAVDQGAPAVVAAGGDGTVSAVASILAGGRVALGVLPMGTLNHFAKDLSIPLDLDGAIATIARGNTQAVDVGEVNGRTFVNNSSLGLYPQIVRDREQRRKHLGQSKWRALLEASINAARRYPVMTVEIEVEGRKVQRRTPFVFIGNSAYTMEGFSIGERSTLSDGLLSLYTTHRTGRFGLLRLAVLALFKRLNQARDFDAFTATAFTVNTHRRRMRVATDGEIDMMATPLVYRVRPAALEVYVP